jgi:hypothetical protein
MPGTRTIDTTFAASGVETCSLRTLGNGTKPGDINNVLLQGFLESQLLSFSKETSASRRLIWQLFFSNYNFIQLVGFF